MGNWRTVTIIGTIDPAEAQAARDFIDVGPVEQGWDRFHCLAYYGPSLCGLGQWIPEGGGQFQAVGNLSERNYGVDDVRDVLIDLVAVAPSLELKVHCGGEYESEDCIATVTVHNGDVRVGDPEVDKVGQGMSELVAQRVDILYGGQR
jgi:hypothetical protein